jgi:ubiquinone/menaquinone biosynthesis C-methylase UbiE
LRERKLQQEYYERTASCDDAMHVTDGDEHQISLRYISAFIEHLSVKSALDVGCGTGRGTEYIHRWHPEVEVIGLEPVRALLDIAKQKGASSTSLIRGSGLDLPFHDRPFDAVIELGVLHHVRLPNQIVMEMCPVAKKTVFISDSNIFGQGRIAVRSLKLFLYKAGLWGLAKFIQTGGRGYTISEGDGLAYSYSVYFEYQLLASWADRVIALPVRSAKKMSWGCSPLLTADTVLLCGIREPTHEY